MITLVNLCEKTSKVEFDDNAAVAQLVERVLGKDEVVGSNPTGSFRVGFCKSARAVLFDGALVKILD